MELLVQFFYKPKIHGRAWVKTKGGENRCASGEGMETSGFQL